MDKTILPFFVMDALISLGCLFFIFQKWSDDNKIYKIIRIIMVCYVIIFITIPGALDVRKAINREYEEFSGVALDSSSKRRTNRDYITIFNSDENKKIKVIIPTPKIKKGNQLTVHYLPHTKYAKVIELEE